MMIGKPTQSRNKAVKTLARVIKPCSPHHNHLSARFYSPWIVIKGYRIKSGDINSIGNDGYITLTHQTTLLTDFSKPIAHCQKMDITIFI